MSDFPVMEYQDPEAPDGETALGLLQAVYRDKWVPLHTRIRCASLAIGYEVPKLAVTGYVADNQSFAVALDRAIERSRAGKVSVGAIGDKRRGVQRQRVRRASARARGGWARAQVKVRPSRGNKRTPTPQSLSSLGEGMGEAADRAVRYGVGSSNLHQALSSCTSSPGLGLLVRR